MKFSVLLPTRNRLEYLKYAVETVRRQDYDDWELIIFDNFSEDDIAGYARSLDDPRVKYFRTDSFVPVTDNWNNALEKSTGDYVIMLGDDDGLMGGFFKTVRRLVEEYDHPDGIYTRAFVYAYPGAMPGYPEGYLQPCGCAEFLNSGDETPFFLDKGRRLGLVRQSMDFKYRFDYNMQFATVSRKFIESVRDKGSFFQSPFPDYYAMNVLFLRAEKVLVYPRPIVTIGVTQKSYGFFHFNNRESEGIKLLNGLPDRESAARLERVLLPGTNMNNGWLFAMQAIAANYGAEYDLRVNYRRYRLLQVLHVFEFMPTAEALGELKERLRPWEKLLYGGCLYVYRALIKVISVEQRVQLIHWLRMKVVRQYPPLFAERIERRYRNLLEVFERVDPLLN